MSMLKKLVEKASFVKKVNSTKSIEKDVKVLKVKLSDEEVRDKSLEAKLVERQGKADQLEELRKQLEKEEILVMRLKNVKLEVESKRHGLEARQNDLEGVLAEADAITEKINSVRKSGASKCQELVRNCGEVIAKHEGASKGIQKGGSASIFKISERISMYTTGTKCSSIFEESSTIKEKRKG